MTAVQRHVARSVLAYPCHRPNCSSCSMPTDTAVQLLLLLLYGHAKVSKKSLVPMCSVDGKFPLIKWPWWSFHSETETAKIVALVFTARCTLVQSAVLRSHAVCQSVCNVGGLWSHFGSWPPSSFRAIPTLHMHSRHQPIIFLNQSKTVST